MSIEEGKIYRGIVTSIRNYGAIVKLPEHKTGLIHISEISDHYVKDIHDFLTLGQTVRVRVARITEDGKINLSLKEVPPSVSGACADPDRYCTPARKNIPPHKAPAERAESMTMDKENHGQQKTENNNFELELQRYLRDSEESNEKNRRYDNRRENRKDFRSRKR